MSQRGALGHLEEEGDQGAQLSGNSFDITG